MVKEVHQQAEYTLWYFFTFPYFARVSMSLLVIPGYHSSLFFPSHILTLLAPHFFLYLP